MPKQTNSAAIIDMRSIDDSSTTSSFEDVGEQAPQFSHKKYSAADPSEGVDVMTGLSGNLGKAVAGQVMISSQLYVDSLAHF